jgi:hypothetical protein
VKKKETKQVESGVPEIVRALEEIRDEIRLVRSGQWVEETNRDSIQVSCDVPSFSENDLGVQVVDLDETPPQPSVSEKQQPEKSEPLVVQEVMPDGTRKISVSSWWRSPAALFLVWGVFILLGSLLFLMVYLRGGST